jgi:signal transduction histidine kinase
MVVQADAARYLIPGAPHRAADSVAAIGGTGRRALAELRELLGVLDAPGSARTADPALAGDTAGDTGQAGHTGRAAGRTPTVGSLGDLITQVRKAGQPVELFEDGTRAPAAASVELAAYRVAQEALTNAVKHAPGRQTTVRIRYGEELDITVTTDGPVIAAGGFTPGRGLTGLRERVTMCGGELTAQGRPEGGFRVRARMPARPTP